MGICVSCRRRERKAPEKRWVPAKGAAAELLPRQIRLPTMANSISNIKMTNPIKGMVSKRRKRYVKDGFNLDLAYITDRIIAMGFPAEKLEGVYRNHIDEVYRFLEQMHKGHYMIYNLCAERKYDAQKFHDRVKKFEFEDHAPPKIEQIQPFCESVHAWLNEDSRNVAAVHCKAGKGRTGTMVCCYLLYSGQKATADEALKFYGKKRTHDEKGVTIPSQRRYVEYYAALVSGRLAYRATRVHVRELRMSPPPALNGGQCTLELVVSQVEPQFKASLGSHELRRHEATARVALQACTPLQGDIKVDVYCKPKMMMRKEKLFHFWFNTFFVTASVGATPVPAPNDSPNLETFKLTLDKWQLDDAHKDKQHKLYSPEFKVELIIQKQPDSSTFSTQSLRAPSTPSSASTCSENDEHWDSGEGFTPADHSVDTPLYSVDAPFYSTETPLYGDSEQSVQTPLYSISGVSMVQSERANTPLYSISSDGGAPLYGYMQPEVSTLRDGGLSVTPPLYTQVPRLNIPVNEPYYITNCNERTDVLTPSLYTLTSNTVGVEPVLPYQNNCLNRPLCTNDKTIFEPTICSHCKHNYNVTTVANENILSGAAPALSNTKNSTPKKSPLLSYKFMDGHSETPLYFVPCNNVLCTKLHKLCNLETDKHSNKLFYDGPFKSQIGSNKFSLDKSDCESPYINIVCGPNCHRQFVSDGQKSEKKDEISNNCTVSSKLHSDWCEGSIKNKRSSDSDMYEMLHESEQCHKKPNCQNINELSLLKLPTDKTEELVDLKVYSNCSSELTDNNLYKEKNDVYFPVDNTFHKSNAEYVEVKSEKPVESSAKSKNVKKEKCRDVSKSRLLGDMRASWREFSGKFGENRKKKHRDD